MKDALHLVPLSYDDDGFPVWETPLTSTGNSKRALVMAPPEHIIPIIFIPGIMGSNLKLKNSIPSVRNKGEFAWRPDAAGTADALLSAGERQQILNPRNTEVDTRFVENVGAGVSLPVGMSQKCAEVRGYGSVYWKSYGELLQYLERDLNFSCFFDPAAARVVIGAQWHELINKGIPLPGRQNIKLHDHEVARTGAYWYPTHAIGYNWLQSNRSAGVYIAGEIRKIKAFYQRIAGTEAACKQVILITHSMGGLAARAAIHPCMGNAAADVMGIVHGVMPAIGAAAAYKRMRTGFEHGEIDWLSLGNVKAELGGQAVAGRNGRDVTAVLGHSPGGLQLLPNKMYLPDGWLSCLSKESGKYKVPIGGNPYASVYREQKKWWRLINPKWLDPTARFSETGPNAAWDSYQSALTEAESFHDALGNQYHRNTYCFYGADAVKRPSYGTVNWMKSAASRQEAFPGTASRSIAPASLKTARLTQW